MNVVLKDSACSDISPLLMKSLTFNVHMKHPSQDEIEAWPGPCKYWSGETDPRVA